MTNPKRLTLNSPWDQWRLVIIFIGRGSNIMKLYSSKTTQHTICWAMPSPLQKCSLIVSKWLWQLSCRLHIFQSDVLGLSPRSLSTAPLCRQQTGEAIKCIAYSASSWQTMFLITRAGEAPAVGSSLGLPGPSSLLFFDLTLCERVFFSSSTWSRHIFAGQLAAEVTQWRPMCLKQHSGFTNHRH